MSPICLSGARKGAHRSSALLALAVSLSTGAGRAEPRQPTHVACVGDSITAGSGASSTAANYPSQLQNLLGGAVTVKNFGNSGSTLLTRPYGDKPYDEQAEYTSATSFVSGAGANALVSVVLVLGANDSKPANWEPSGKPKNDQQFLQDYRALVDHFLGLSPKLVVYVGLPLATGTSPCCNIRGDVIVSQELPLIEQVAVEKRLPIIDLNAPTSNHPEYFGDGVHPNDAGYLVLANLVKTGLAREPKVTLVTTPSPGGTVALSADAGDSTVDFASVEFFEGATSLGKATTKPFSIDWAAPPGTHTLSAKATDTTLATGTSAPVVFNLDDQSGSAGRGGGGGATNGSAGSAPNGGTSNEPTPNGGTTGAGTAGSMTQPGVADAVNASGGSGATTSNGSAGSSASSARKTDSGCGCRWARSSRGVGGSLLLLGVSVLALRRRRRAR